MATQPNKLIIARHGDTTLNSEDKIRGWLNVPLDKNGKKAAVELADTLKDKNIDGIISSDLIRAKQTSKILSRHLGVPVIKTSPKLRTWKMGELNGQDAKSNEKVIEDLVKKYPDAMVKGAESFDTFKKRLITEIKGIAHKNPDKTLAIVTHHSCINALKGWDKLGQEGVKVDSKTYLAKGIDPGSHIEMEIK